MIWTMSRKLLKSSDIKAQLVNKMHPNITEINCQVSSVLKDNRSPLKRKLSDLEPLMVQSRINNLNMDLIFDGGFPPDRSVKLPTNSEDSGSRCLNRKELKNLRMQIAMISDADGDRPIHVAVVQENLRLVQKLCAIMLKTAISLDLTNYLRQTPLHLAVMLGNVEMVKLLLKCGSSLTLKDRNGNSVVHLAVKTAAKKDVLCLILSHPQASTILNSMDHEGYTALHYAVIKRNKVAVTCLHRSGADMDVTDGKSGRTALIHAILEKNVDMVKTLLDCDANVEIVDYSGRSAFELALLGSNKEVVELLDKKIFSEEFLKSSTTAEAFDEREDLDESVVAKQRTKKFKRT